MDHVTAEQGITNTRYFTDLETHFVEDFLTPALNLYIANAYFYNDRVTTTISMASSITG
uniref:Uncharacterized protein n=1 Tax=Oryza punctata TaxID=4537 RepID=A0A0E0LTV3_ORYPU